MPAIYKAVDVVAKDTLVVSEYIGNVASGNSKLSASVADVKAPTEETFYTPQHDEYVIVISGEVHIHTSATEKVVVHAGESCTLTAGEEIKWSWQERCQYVHLRMPAVEKDYHTREGDAAVEVLPGGSHCFATASLEGNVKLWDMTGSKLLRDYTGHKDQVMSVEFSSDGTKLLSSSTDRTAKIWSLESGECVQTFTGHEGPVLTASFSPDNLHILTASQDKCAKLWSTETGKCEATYSGHDKMLHSAGFSSDGKSIATASDDTTARLWDTQSRDCKLTCRHVVDTHRLCILFASPRMAKD